MMRQKRKQMLTIANPKCFSLVLFIILFSIVTSFAQNLFLQNKIVTDPLTGAALEGFDAVSYFTEQKPELGRAEYEYIWNGVSWYFSNQANREVFTRAPEIYAPQFGGHGAMGLARGYIIDGNANIYELLGGRLFLFYSNTNRDAFMLSQRTSYIKAKNNWEFFLTDLLPSE